MRPPSWLLWPVTLAALAGLLAGAYLINHAMRAERGAEADEAVTQPARRQGNDIVLRREEAEENGIEAASAEPVEWSAPVTVYGRLVPNPRTTTQLLAPVAGTLQDAADWPAVGSSVRAGQKLGEIRLRVGPQEWLDVRQKLREAQAKHQGTEKLIGILTERLSRLEKSSVASQRELEDVRVMLTEARTNLSVARSTEEVLRRALDAGEKGEDGGPYRLALTVPADGEVVESPVRPGSALEAGALLLKVIDFRRPLAQLELPTEVLAAGVPPRLELNLLPSAPGRKGPPTAPLSASLVGPAPQVEPGSPFTAFWYESQLQVTAQGAPALTWRPGRFVTAQVRLADAARQKAVTVPDEAVVAHQGRTLVYVLEKETPKDMRYERREVQVLGRDGDRVVLGRGVRAGERVVHRQAQVLLSEEFRGAAEDD